MYEPDVALRPAADDERGGAVLNQIARIMLYHFVVGEGRVAAEHQEVPDDGKTAARIRDYVAQLNQRAR